MNGRYLALIIASATGIGALLAGVAIVDVNVWPSEPYPKAIQLRMVGYRRSGGLTTETLYPFQYAPIRKMTDIFSAFAAVSPSFGKITVDGHLAGYKALKVTEGTFDVFGIKNFVGRDFTDIEYRNNASNVAVVSYKFAKRYLGGAREAVGESIHVGRKLCTIIGVIPKDQQWPPYFSAGVYLPFQVESEPTAPFRTIINAIVRLRSDVPVETARKELAAIRPKIAPQYSAYIGKEALILQQIRHVHLYRGSRGYKYIVASIIILFLITVMNSASLFITRAIQDIRKYCIRIALGASYREALRPILDEVLFLSLLSGILGWIVAHTILWFLNVIGLGFSDGAWEVMNGFGILTVGFCAVVFEAVFLSATVGILFRRYLRDGGGLFFLRNSDIRFAGEKAHVKMLIIQIACSIILVAGSQMMMKTVANLRAVSAGIDVDRVMRAVVMVPPGLDSNGEELLERLNRLCRQLAYIPGVQSAAYGSNAFLSGQQFTPFRIAAEGGEERSVKLDFVSANYARVVGLRLLKGNWFSRFGGGGTVVINDRLARTVFGKKDPIGRVVHISPGEFKGTVIGVVSNVRQSVRAAPERQVFYRARVFAGGVNTLALRVKEGEVNKDALRDIISKALPGAVVVSLEKGSEIIGAMLGGESDLEASLRVVADVAVLLVVFGVFASLLFMVEIHMKEFGIRVALGSTRLNLATYVCRKALMYVGIGVVFGVMMSIGLGYLMRDALYGITGLDISLILRLIVTFGLVALVGSFWPAIRATEVNLCELLKGE